MNMTEKVIDIIKNISGENHICEQDDLQKDIGLDSLGMVTLLMELEEMLAVQLDESDMNPFDLSTVADVVRLAKKYCEGDDEKEG